MSGFRWAIEASAGPARAGTPACGDRASVLVRVRLFDPPDQTWPHTRPQTFTDLAPDGARELAFELLAVAEHAEYLTHAQEDR